MAKLSAVLSAVMLERQLFPVLSDSVLGSVWAALSDLVMVQRLVQVWDCWLGEGLDSALECWTVAELGLVSVGALELGSGCLSDEESAAELAAL